MDVAEVVIRKGAYYRLNKGGDVFVYVDGYWCDVLMN